MRVVAKFVQVGLFASLLCAGFVSCTKSGGDGRSSEDGGGGTDFNDPFRSECGAVQDSVLQNPVDLGNAEDVNVRVVGPNLVVILQGSGRLVRLHGIDASPFAFERANAEATLRSFAAQRLIFVPVLTTGPCLVTTTGGGQGEAGYLYTQNGVNIGEKLLADGDARLLANDACGGQLLNSCYNALTDGSDAVGGIVQQFLWKPVSDSDGKLVVTLNPAASLTLQGEEFRDAGPGNGRSSALRASKPGCSYGSNIALTGLRDKNGRRLVGPDGNTIVIGNGCNRVEIN